MNYSLTFHVKRNHRTEIKEHEKSKEIVCPRLSFNEQNIFK